MNEDNRVTLQDGAPGKRIAATGSVIGAVMASACCIVPLLLVTLGVSGAWIGSLSVLDPYKPWFAAITMLFLGLGFWLVYWKPRRECEEGSYCASPGSDRVVKFALWSATVLVVLALTIDYWAPLFY